MRIKTVRIRIPLLSACVLMAAVPVAWSNGGGEEPEFHAREQTPQDKARSLYNDGVHDVKKADKLQASALQQSDTSKKDKAHKQAQELYSSALSKFQEATENDSRMHEAWNYLGYTNRKLGNYDVALSAYEKALTLK